MALEDAGQAAAAEIGITWRPVPSDGEGGHACNHISRKDRLFLARSEGDLDLAAIEQRRKRVICWLIRLLPTSVWPMAGKVVRFFWRGFSRA